MKKIHGLFVSFVLLAIVSCSSDDYQKPPVITNNLTSIWPLDNFNYWLMAKDSINDTIKIDTSFYQNDTKFFETVGLSKFILPNQQNIPTSIYIKDSIYYLVVPEMMLSDNGQNIIHSTYTIPLIQENLKTNENLIATTEFSKTYTDSVITVSINSSSKVLEKNSLEAVSGQVFNQITKIKNTYSYTTNFSSVIINREIWFQPGVGLVKIIDQNNAINYLMVNYNLADTNVIQ